MESRNRLELLPYEIVLKCLLHCPVVDLASVCECFRTSESLSLLSEDSQIWKRHCSSPQASSIRPSWTSWRSLWSLLDVNEQRAIREHGLDVNLACRRELKLLKDFCLPLTVSLEPNAPIYQHGEDGISSFRAAIQAYDFFRLHFDSTILEQYLFGLIQTVYHCVESQDWASARQLIRFDAVRFIRLFSVRLPSLAVDRFLLDCRQHVQQMAEGSSTHQDVRSLHCCLEIVSDISYIAHCTVKSVYTQKLVDTLVIRSRTTKNVQVARLLVELSESVQRDTRSGP